MIAHTLPPLVIDFLQKCQMPCIFSTSVKLSENGISDRRWLLTIPKTSAADAEIETIESLAMHFVEDCKGYITETHKGSPSIQTEFQGFEQAIKNRFGDVVCLHIGFDQENKSEIRKFYYEYDNQCSTLQFMALKSSKDGLDLHQYKKVDPTHLLRELELPSSLKILIKELITAAGPSLTALDVASQKTFRRSIDLNLTECHLDTNLKNIIARLILEVNPRAVYSLSAKYSRPSHIAIGVNADARPFITLYGAAYWVTPDLKIELIE